MTQYRIIVTQTNEWVGDFENQREAAKEAYNAIWDESTGDYDYRVSVVPVDWKSMPFVEGDADE